MESRESGDEFSYCEVAKRFNVDRTTLSWRHKRKQATNAASGEAQRHLNPKQEQELVQHIERRTRRGLPPTREMQKDFASAVAKWEVSHSWVNVLDTVPSHQPSRFTGRATPPTSAPTFHPPITQHHNVSTKRPCRDKEIKARRFFFVPRTCQKTHL